jgi:hypothetical protein
MGANALRLPSTDPDPAGSSLQVGGSPLDSLKPWQTPDSCLGVKGVAGSNPAVPTGRRLVGPGSPLSKSQTKSLEPDCYDLAMETRTRAALAAMTRSITTPPTTAGQPQFRWVTRLTASGCAAR